MAIAKRWSVLGLVAAVTGSVALAQDGVPQPTQEHAIFKNDVGTWDATIKIWMGPGEPAVSKGKEVNRMMPGNLWMISEFEGEFAGQPFYGHGQNGYDPIKKKYVATWVDSMSTSAILMLGTYDEATHTLTMEGESTGPDGTPMKLKNVSVLKPDGTRVFTMSMKSDATGPEYVRMMEITYTKKK